MIFLMILIVSWWHSHAHKSVGFTDDLLAEREVLLWLKKNRFKNMELDLFMYSILAVAVTFVLYTAFLLFGFKPKDESKQSDEEDEDEAEMSKWPKVEKKWRLCY